MDAVADVLERLRALSSGAEPAPPAAYTPAPMTAEAAAAAARAQRFADEASRDPYVITRTPCARHGTGTLTPTCQVCFHEWHQRIEDRVTGFKRAPREKLARALSRWLPALFGEMADGVGLTYDTPLVVVDDAGNMVIKLGDK
jgi:hypothetical protein